MMQSPEPYTHKQESTYLLNAESAAEMARLMHQDHLITQGMGGLFPEGLDLSHVHRILDVACGPGGWALEVAFAHTDKEVVGVDISHTMITYARAQAQVQHLENASFEIMNALGPLGFPDHSFDLVNARLIVGFMLPSAWPTFLAECMRILRPGGILRLTETEWGFTNKPGFEKMCGLINLALAKVGQSFSPNGRHAGIVPMLSHFLKDAGCERIGRMAHALEFSYGTEAHEGTCRDLATVFSMIQPLLVKTQVASQDELEQLYQQVLAEMEEEDFCALWFYLTVWGYKPGGPA